MAEPISIKEARKRERTPAATDDAPCPVTALGHLDGKFTFLDLVGQKRTLNETQIGRRTSIEALFLGATDWLVAQFPAHDDTGRIVGFSAGRASLFLMSACRVAGLYGPHVRVRGIGVWRGDTDQAIAHCGDAVFVGGQRLPPGLRIGHQVFTAAHREQYPGDAPAGPDIARDIQSTMADLWLFRDAGSPIMLLGLVAAGTLGGALSWRPNGFLSGKTNSGKSSLLDLLRAMCPLHHYTTDTTKAGVEGAVNGRAVPIIIDEATDRVADNGAQTLLNIVLSASSGDGTRLHRGTAEGGVREIEVCASVIMAAVNPPPMQPAHRSRFSLIELLQPEAGADHRDEMIAAVAHARAHAPAIFSRLLAAYPRYLATLPRMRAALRHAQCLPREMDHLGAILTGWWCLVEDGLPSTAEASSAVAAIAEHLRGAEALADEDSSNLVLAHLTSKIVSLDRSTDQENLARIIASALSADPEDDARRYAAIRVLERYGLRAVRKSDEIDAQGRPIPRLAEGAGLWLHPNCAPLAAIFTGTPYSGTRWLAELLRLPSARRSKSSVRIGAFTPCKAVWLTWEMGD